MKNVKRTKRILAWIGIVLLVALYVVTFILALLESPAAQAMFRGSLYMTVMIPFLLYAFMLVYRVLNRSNDETDSGNPEKNEDRKQ